MKVKTYILLPVIALLVSFSFPNYSYTQDSNVPIDCLEQRHEAEYQCGQIHKVCVEGCSGYTIDQCISACFDEEYRCNDIAKAAYFACLEEQQSILQPINQPSDSPNQPSEASLTQSPQSQNGQSTEKPNDFKPWMGDTIPVFIGEWFQAVTTGMMMEEFAYHMSGFADEVLFGGDRAEIAEEEKMRKEKELENKLNDEALWQYGVDPKDILERKPKLRESNLSERLINAKRFPDSPYTADFIEGDVMIKRPDGWDWEPFGEGTKIPPGSTIFTGMDSSVLLTIEGKGIVELLSFTEITISEEGLEQAAKERKTSTEIKLRLGEVELNVERGVYTGSLQVHTPNVVAGVRGTHFWVSYNKDNNLSTVGVYEGTVEVKTIGGKIVTIRPDGDEPGVIVIAQKFSIT
ncbi:FecR domain-containing protein, partial [Candidatus Roizmanbacteria bacterium]|nr:FecR domain-containing protein [Candidatus Roizmanbacteria bacterium]